MKDGIMIIILRIILINNNIIENVNELYKDNSSDNMTIKKLLGLKSLRNNFDCYFN